MQVEGWEKEQVGKVSAVEVCWELSKTLHLLGNSSERDMVTLLTVTQLSQATIYEKQLTPEQGRAKRELQTHPGPTVGPHHLPRASQGPGKMLFLDVGAPPNSSPAPWGGLCSQELLGAGEGAPAPTFWEENHSTALVSVSLRSPQTTHLKALFIIIALIDLSFIFFQLLIREIISRVLYER